MRVATRAGAGRVGVSEARFEVVAAPVIGPSGAVGALPDKSAAAPAENIP